MASRLAYAPKAPAVSGKNPAQGEKAAGSVALTHSGYEDAVFGLSERAPMPKADGQAPGGGFCETEPPQTPVMASLQFQPLLQPQATANQRADGQLDQPSQHCGVQRLASSWPHSASQHCWEPASPLPMVPSPQRSAHPMPTISSVAPAVSAVPGGADTGGEDAGFAATRTDVRLGSQGRCGSARGVILSGGVARRSNVDEGCVGMETEGGGSTLKNTVACQPFNIDRATFTLQLVDANAEVEGGAGEVEKQLAPGSAVQQQQQALLQGGHQLLRSINSIGAHCIFPSPAGTSCPMTCVPCSTSWRADTGTWSTASRQTESVPEQPAVPVFSAGVHAFRPYSAQLAEQSTDVTSARFQLHTQTSRVMPPPPRQQQQLGEHGTPSVRKLKTEGCNEHDARTPAIESPQQTDDPQDAEALPTPKAPTANRTHPEAATVQTRTFSLAPPGQAVADTDKYVTTEPERVEASRNVGLQVSLQRMGPSEPGDEPLPTPLARRATANGPETPRTGKGQESRTTVAAAAAPGTQGGTALSDLNHWPSRGAVSAVAAATTRTRGDGAPQAPMAAAAVAVPTAAPTAVTPAAAATATGARAPFGAGARAVAAAEAPKPFGAAAAIDEEAKAALRRTVTQVGYDREGSRSNICFCTPPSAAQPWLAAGASAAERAGPVQPPAHTDALAPPPGSRPAETGPGLALRGSALPGRRSLPPAGPAAAGPTASPQPQPKQRPPFETQPAPDPQEPASQFQPSAQQTPLPAPRTQTYPRMRPAPTGKGGWQPLPPGSVPIPPPVHVTVAASAAKRPKNAPPLPLFGRSRKRPHAEVLSALDHPEDNPVAAAAKPIVAAISPQLSEQPSPGMCRPGSRAGARRDRAPGDWAAAPDDAEASMKEEAPHERVMGSPRSASSLVGGRAAAVTTGAGASVGGGLPVVPAALARQRRTVSLGGFVLTVPGNVVCEVLGLFHPQRYLDGGDCMEVPPGSGKFISRSHFEKVGGAVTAKWHRSIRIIPSLEHLGDWLTRHSLPVFKGGSRKRAAKGQALDQPNVGSGLTSSGSGGAEAAPGAVTPGAVAKPIASPGHCATSSQGMPDLATAPLLAAEARSPKAVLMASSKGPHSPTPAAADGLRLPTSPPAPTTDADMPPQRELPAQDQALLEDAPATDEHAAKPGFTIAATAGATALEDELVTRIPKYAPMPSWPQWWEEEALNWSRPHVLRLHPGPCGMAAGLPLAPPPRALPTRAPSLANARSKPGLVSSSAIINPCTLAAPPALPLFLPSYPSQHRGHARPKPICLAWPPLPRWQPRQGNPFAAAEASRDPLEAYGDAAEPYKAADVRCSHENDDDGEAAEVAARPPKVQLARGRPAGADLKMQGSTAQVQGLQIASPPSGLTMSASGSAAAGFGTRAMAYGCRTVSHLTAAGRRPAEPQKTVAAALHHPEGPQLETPYRSPLYGGLSQLVLYGTPLAVPRPGAIAGGLPGRAGGQRVMQPLDGPNETWTPQPPGSAGPVRCQSQMGSGAAPGEPGTAPARHQQAQTAPKDAADSGERTGAAAAAAGGDSAGPDAAAMPRGSVYAPSPYIPYFYPRRMPAGGWRPRSAYNPAHRQTCEAAPYTTVGGVRVPAAVQPGARREYTAALSYRGFCADRESRQTRGPLGSGGSPPSSRPEPFGRVSAASNESHVEQASAPEGSDAEYETWAPPSLRLPVSAQSRQAGVHHHNGTAPQAATIVYSQTQEQPNHLYHVQPPIPFQHPPPLRAKRARYLPHLCPPLPKHIESPVYPSLHPMYQPEALPPQLPSQQQQCIPGPEETKIYLPSENTVCKRHSTGTGQMASCGPDAGCVSEGVEPLEAETVGGVEPHPATRKRKAMGGQESNA